jgi:hypothetical protein
MNLTTTKPVRHDIGIYCRNPTNPNNPALIQTGCFDSVPLALCGVLSARPTVVVLSQYLTRT